MKKWIWSVLAIPAILFLFTRTSDVVFGSSILFNCLSILSIAVLVIFSYKYFSTFEDVLVKQLKKMRKNDAAVWIKWFSLNISEWTAMLFSLTPYILILLSLSKGISFYFPAVSSIQTVSFGIAMFVCMFMIFLIITVMFSWLFHREETN
ncbi:hypothetical protein [Bacillus toyonensis]|uniref:hypothetical protein n=1 Tax=Bacillus toyonensis TaxID=155322 RepID=UPI002E22FF67|nr:hypothetical protein [Bacillus toyonensis]